VTQDKEAPPSTIGGKMKWDRHAARANEVKTER
jgi:hypothetical protein